MIIGLVNPSHTIPPPYIYYTHMHSKLHTDPLKPLLHTDPLNTFLTSTHRRCRRTYTFMYIYIQGLIMSLMTHTCLASHVNCRTYAVDACATTYPQISIIQEQKLILRNKVSCNYKNTFVIRGTFDNAITKYVYIHVRITFMISSSRL